MKLVTCCGCCSLQKGSLIIGILSLIGGLTSLIGVSKFVAMIGVHNESIKDYPPLVAANRAIGAGILTYVILMIVLVSLFIYGNIQRQPCFILPYLCVGFTNLLTFFAAIIFVLTYLCSVPGFPGIYIFLCFLFIAIFYAVGVYFWLVIFFFYKEIVNEGFGQIPQVRSTADLQ